MSLIKKQQMNGYNFYYYDNNWQKPVITEQQIFQLFNKHKNIPTNYFAFPWAELCDNSLNNYLKKDILLELNKFKITDNICFTVIQHIHFRKILHIIKKIEITHIFVSHKQLNDIELEKKFNL